MLRYHSPFVMNSSNNYPPYITQIDGIYLLNIPQFLIFEYPLPPTSSQSFNAYKKFGNFNIFRTFLQNALVNIDTTSASIMASFAWRTAREDFKTFFKNYANSVKREVNARKNVFRFKPYDCTKSSRKQAKSRRNKNSDDVGLNQEQFTGWVFGEELKTFQFIN
ncbi:9808_t:CDS:1 [Funneliformis caledonium]|uniref:9808_t:CDS:1 n=1 Tax=Funneliformis caledonium TaxID=1117310 RepID=A0A9N8V927_9GLOM|nr:9808_t:CDS:1 [Funneliformis caledonium]